MVTDQTLLVFLQLRKLHLLNLKPRWETSLVSRALFDSHIVNAAQTASELLSIHSNSFSNNLILCELPNPNHQETEGDGDQEPQEPQDDGDQAGANDSIILEEDEDTIIILDMLPADDGSQNDIEEKIDAIDIPFLWIIPVSFFLMLRSTLALISNGTVEPYSRHWPH